MPLTTEEKQKYLQLQGLDPNLYDIDDNTVEPVLRSQSAQVNPVNTIVGQPIVSKKEYSPLNTAGRNFGLGVLPALGGFGAGAGASALANSWTEMIPPPFGQIAHGAATIGGGILGALATAKAQEALINTTEGGKQFMQETAESNQQNPLSAVGGNLAASLPFMRVNPTMLKDAARAAMAGEVRNPALLNTMLGAGVGAGQGLYDEYQNPEEFNLGRILLNTAGGALINDPRKNKIMSKMGLHPYQRPESYGVFERGLPSVEIPPTVEQPTTEFPSRVRSKAPSASIRSEGSLLKGLGESDAMARYESTDPVRLEEERMSGEGGTAPDNALAIERQRKVDLANAEALEKQRQAALLKAENDQKELELSRMVDEGGGVREQQGKQQPVAEKLTDEELQARAIQPVNQTIAKQRGVNLKVLPPEQKTFTGTSGKEVTGEVNVGNREATITQAKPDTGAHEVQHVTINDLTPRLKERLFSQVEKDKVHNDWITKERAEGRNPDTEEFLAQAGGEDFVKRVVNKDSNLRRDLVAWFRAHIMSNASAADVVRVLGNRMVYGSAPSGKVNLVGGIRNQPQQGDEKLKPVNVTYAGVQKGYTSIKNPEKSIPDMHLYNVNEDGHSKFPKGTTVTEEGLRKEGYRLGDIGEAGEATREQGVKQAKVAPQYEKYIPEKLTKEEQESSVKSGENFSKAMAISQDDFKRFKYLEDKVHNDKADDLELTEYENLHGRINEKAYQNDEIYPQINKQDLPGIGETIPDIAKSQDVEQKPVKLETDTSKKGFFKPFEATFDKAERVSTKHAEAFRRTDTLAARLNGLKNVALVDLQKYPRDDVNRVFNARRDAFRNDKAFEPTGEDKKINDVLKYYDDIRNKQIETGMKIDGREAGKNKNYVNDSLNDQTLDLWINKSQTPQAKASKLKLIQHIMDESEGKVSQQEAEEYVKQYSAAMRGESNNYKSIKFGALRKAQGYGLPESLRETDAIRALEKYGRRASKDLAFFSEIESKPDIAGPLDIPNPETGKPYEGNFEDISSAKEITDSMKWFTGSYKSHSPKVNSVVRTIVNGILGPATGTRDVVSIGANSLPYINKWSDLGAFVKGMSQFRQNSRKALEMGARQPSIDKLMFNEVLDAPDRFSAVMNKVATGLRKYQGREFLENLSRDVVFSGGKELARNNVIGAKAGDAKSKDFLKKFGTLIDEDVTKLSGSKLEDALDKIAANFVDRNQGTYGGRGLPIGMVEGSLAPFFALQKWSVEKSNVIYQDVVKPALEGKDYTPFLSYTLGSTLTGLGIQELNKLLTGRKAQDPDLKETLAFKDDPKAIVSELATLMQLGSYAGIISDGVKMANDVVLKGKAARNIVSFPAATSVVDLGERLSDVSEALKQGEDPWNTLKGLVLDTLTHNVQAARIAGNYTWKKEDVNRSDKFRDLRVFNELSGEPVGDIGKTNPYLGQAERKFKRTGDITEAAEQLPSLLEKFSEKAKENPAKAIQFLKSLKANNFQTVPNPENMPTEFVRYWNYLRETQGQDKAQERIQEYFQQNELNKVKSSMVP